MKHARLFLACMLWAVIATTLNAQTTPSDALKEGDPIYLMNVGTGLYLKFGGAGNAKAAEGHAGTAITLAQSGKGYTIKTKDGWYLDGNLNMTSTTSTVWTFVEVDATNKYYHIKNNDNNKRLASKNDVNGLLELQDSINGVSKQKWMLVTRDQLSYLFDMTPTIKAASFDINDNTFDINDNTKGWSGIKNDMIKSNGVGTDSENYYLQIDGKATVSQNIGTNFRGSTALSFYANCTAGSASVTISSHNQSAEIQIPTNSKWERCTKQVISIGNNAGKPIILTITTTSGTQLSIDNFEIQYINDEDATSSTFDAQEQTRYENRAKREIEDIRSEIAHTNSSGGTYFNNAIENLTLPKNDSEFRTFLNNINQIKDNALNAKDDPKLNEMQTEQKAETGFYPTITVNRTLKANTWSTFVVPFKMNKPEGWEVKTLTGSTLNNNNITLTFSDANTIEAGVPYMVRVQKEVSSIVGTNVTLKETLTNVSTEHVEFTGVYTNGYVPAGAFFISSNTFYRAADNSNTMKAFRAYLMPTTKEGQAALSLSYRTDGETTAIDNSQLANDNEATVVAIYNLQGVRLDDMQEGVNILQMSDGSVVKVIIM